MNTNLNTVETITEKLRERKAQSAVFRALLSFFEQRLRGRQEINIVRLKRRLEAQGVSLQDGALAAEFRMLQELGLGKIVHVKDQPSRFHFQYNLRSIANVANGKDYEVKRQRPTKFVLPRLVAGQPELPEPVKAVPEEVSPVTTGLVVIKRNGVEYQVPEHVILKLLA